MARTPNLTAAEAILAEGTPLANGGLRLDPNARYIAWDMGTYGPFADEDEARAYQRAHRMTGSSIVTAGELG